MRTIAIHSKQTITPSGLRDAFVIIRDGIILDVVDSMPDAGIEIKEVGESVLMPGIVDPHVHINEPGRTDWEGFNTATRAAIAGAG